MKASEARKLTDEVNDINMKKIYDQIEITAKSGKDYLEIDVPNRSTDKIIKELKDNGFVGVGRYSCHDIKETDKYRNVLTIKW